MTKITAEMLLQLFPPERNPVTVPMMNDWWSTTGAGNVIVVAKLATPRGPFVFYDSARGREICAPGAWRKIVSGGKLIRRSEETLPEDWQRMLAMAIIVRTLKRRPP